MDLRKIKKLIELVEESGISELEVRDGEEAIRIARPATSFGVAPAPPVSVPSFSEDRLSAPAAADTIQAPMAGTFYAASEPGAEPFVRVGARVEAGDVVCIIESMKMMNEITAPSSGVCTSVAVENGQAVSSGQLLFRLN
ncbi:MAG: acetyl-CoA carboxylase biotin carboxyl carrier protein [Gammaproteobacteria bacterium]|nr:acetyl-CoA carboxylase biotin carboxyl carrier protein [Gammaproteobacteria bacterium]